MVDLSAFMVDPWGAKDPEFPPRQASLGRVIQQLMVTPCFQSGTLAIDFLFLLQVVLLVQSFLIGLSAFALVAIRAPNFPSFICFRVRKLDNVVEEEDGEWIRFLGGNSSSGTKKYRGSNSNDGGNTRDGVKIAGGVIGSGDEIDDPLGSYRSRKSCSLGYRKNMWWDENE
ncbi:hypothetical protein Tco_0988475 [Tanacetum coccineum]|uniref:Uncharacterized protein n=2 Tax=Tanacetum coccineum TaxID=301880 RepID=A0ABQ5ER05_9ASTR